MGPVLDLAETIEDPQVRHRAMVAEIDGRAVGPGSPFKLSGFERPPPVRAPALGEHTATVLAEAGYDEAAVASLRAAGAV